jgi:putative membrane protein
MWPYMRSMGWWMVLWWLVAIVILVVVVRLVPGSLGGPRGRADESPEQILKRRYARGEIEREDYQRRLEDLQTLTARTT